MSYTRNHHNSSNSYPDFKNLAKDLSQKSIQDNVIDYPMNLGQRHGFELESLANRAVSNITKVSQIIKEKVTYLYNYSQVLQQQINSTNGSKKSSRQIAKDTAQYIDLKIRIANQYRELKEKSDKSGTVMSELKGYDKFYKLSCARDKKAFDLLQLKQSKSLDHINIKNFHPVLVEKEANRYEHFKIVRELIKANPAKLTDPLLAQQSHKISLKNDAVTIKQETRKAGLSGAVFNARLQTLQQTHRQKLYGVLKKEYPLLNKYQTLVDKRKNLSGYQAEQADKNILKAAKAIMADKGLQTRLEQDLPNLVKRIHQQIHTISQKKWHEH